MTNEKLERHHGGLHSRFAQAVGVSPDTALDFSVNVNPFGPSPRVRKAILGAPIEVYPDPESWDVRCALAESMDEVPERIAIGNGACELLWTLAKLLHRPGDVVVTVEPTFSEYAAAVGSAGAVACSVRAEESNDFAFPLDQIVAVAREKNAQSVYLCCPTSPLGQLTSVGKLQTLANQLGSTRLIIDESFLSLSSVEAGRERLVGENVILVRSLTKELGTPGVRVGYLVGPTEVVSGLDEHRPRWTVSAAAQAAAIASLGDAEFLDSTRKKLVPLREHLCGILERHGFTPFPGFANYITARSPVPVPELKTRLLEDHRVMIRDCRSFGLPDYARFAVRPQSELSALDEALGAALRNMRHE